MLKVEQFGIVSLQGRTEVAVRTRDPKSNVGDRDNILRGWIDKAASVGFYGKEVLEAAHRAADVTPVSSSTWS